jgi:type I restriction enzyme R subunit
MSAQSEAILENNLIKQLIGLGYESVQVYDGDVLLSNLKSQLETFNQTKFTAKEFDAIVNHLAKGNVFEKSKTLRDRYNLKREDNTSCYVRFFDNDNWNKNKFQVTNQVQQQGSFL